MNIKKSTLALAGKFKDYRSFPFEGFQLSNFITAYLDGRISARSNTIASTYKFKIKLSKSYFIFLKPEHMGMAKGVLVDEEYSNLRQYLNPKEQPSKSRINILDLGSNVGLSALYLADEFHLANICCVEADPRNFELLSKNLRVNEVNAQIIFGAVSAEDSQLLELRFGNNSTCSTLISEKLIHSAHTDKLTIPTVSIEKIMNKLKWDKIDILKIDIEGAEDDLLKSSPHWLSSVSLIIMEIHPNTSPDKIQAYLKPYGFQVVRHSFGSEPVYAAFK